MPWYENDPDLRFGVVFRKSQGYYTVHSEGQIILCEISTRLRKVLVYPIADPSSLRPVVQDVLDITSQDPVAIGDTVGYMPAGERGLIVQIEPRHNELVRRTAGRKQLKQVIAANLDRALPVFATAQPKPAWNLLDRYLVAIEEAGIQAVIVISKVDLGIDEQDQAVLNDYRRIGYPVLLTSAQTGEGLDELGNLLSDGTSLLMGKSGVGKSTLINALYPGLELKTQQISAANNKGRHTTTTLEMIQLPDAGRIIDTPGMREFDLGAPDPQDLAMHFVEMRKHVGKCKFGLSCSHSQEPGCAILAAHIAGKISQRRLESYHKLR